jgi:hypothetical protein
MSSRARDRCENSARLPAVPDQVRDDVTFQPTKTHHLCAAAGIGFTILSRPPNGPPVMTAKPTTPIITKPTATRGTVRLALSL